ncbi:unnamed protein product [Protopolystoma xenopodis]|uniref:Uncharacterized protein n=1 Tax=Protopolystoma xenopodis TaxID=117903 RepID=A0A3S5CLF2_9PLAT|nr:unnamed protein product [Protopolystoma xenopodis]
MRKDEERERAGNQINLVTMVVVARAASGEMSKHVKFSPPDGDFAEEGGQMAPIDRFAARLGGIYACFRIENRLAVLLPCSLSKSGSSQVREVGQFSCFQINN